MPRLVAGTKPPLLKVAVWRLAAVPLVARTLKHWGLALGFVKVKAAYRPPVVVENPVPDRGADLGTAQVDCPPDRPMVPVFVPSVEVKPAPVGAVRLKVPEMVGTRFEVAPPIVREEVATNGLPLVSVAVMVRVIGEPQAKLELIPMTNGVPELLAFAREPRPAAELKAWLEERLGSAMATVKHFRRNNLLFPRRQRPGMVLVWAPLTHALALHVLRNPRYAGCYVHGQTRTRRTPDGKSKVKCLAQDEWQVVLPGAHPGYITWEQYQSNRRTLRNNSRAHAAGDEVRTVIAGYHWFTDWGRDTMISLEGLALVTGRSLEA